VDDTLRSALRLSSDEARVRAAVTSDWLLRILVALPLVLDALFAATFLRRRRLLAAALFVSSALTLSLTGLIHGWVSRDIGRERPYVQECARPAPPADCRLGGAVAQVSFYSGHTATTAAGATLAWLHFTYAPAKLAVLKWLVRGLASLGAFATGMLRILADRHYATDVIAGALAGVALALLVFRLLRLMPGSKP
jgi:membrane-associated phospholipid phosphatase